jgi:starch synthase (maltosyl-transferring)
MNQNRHLTGATIDPPSALDPQMTIPPSFIEIENVWPEIDGGESPIKREVGDTVTVHADIFREGHDLITAHLLYRRWREPDWKRKRMVKGDNDRWHASFPVTENTRYLYTISAYPDPYESWVHEVVAKHNAGLDISLEIREGKLLLESLVAADNGNPAFQSMIERVNRTVTNAAAYEILTSDQMRAFMREHLPFKEESLYAKELEVVVDRVRARYATWYEIFPRSAGRNPDKSGTFRDVINRLDDIAKMGFDILYFTPIHPIGQKNRKGRNNTLRAEEGDPGSPYAIGSEAGGHDAIHPELGTLEDFRLLVEEARQRDMEIALDLAIQASPDHPWAQEHPEWFYRRPDGSIKYAENPPKKYEDIYPMNFGTSEWEALWEELKRIVLFWVDQGVTTFRVDNPHTKPVTFWKWLIREVQTIHPEVVFLSEAFTRPKMMKALAKAGFTQSYTYFTWRNFKGEIIDYFTELTTPPESEYMRGNLFPNTHDILPVILQQGGRPAFKIRATLAATLSSVYGIYSGFELCEATPVPSKEEYLNSEKYEFKVLDWDRPGNIKPYIARLNEIRRAHAALQEYDNLRFYWSDDDHILCYAKVLPEEDDALLIVVNLDPFQPHETMIHFPPEELGVGNGDEHRATDLISNQTYLWTGGRQYVRLDPQQESAHIFAIRRWDSVDYEETC